MKFDQIVSNKQFWSFSFQHGQNASSLGAPFGILGPLNSARLGPVSETLVRLSNIYTFSPNLVNHFTYGYNRDPQAQTDPQKGVDWPTKLGFKGVNFGDPTMPSIRFDTNSFVPLHQADNVTGYSIIPNSYVFEEQLSWIKGKHNFKFGADLRWQGENFGLDGNSGDFCIQNPG